MTAPHRTDDLLDQIEEALKEATPAPWQACMGSGLNQCTALMHEGAGGQSFFVADFCPDYVLERDYWTRGDHIPDLKLVESAPEWLAALVVRVRQAEQERDTLREALQKFGSHLARCEAVNVMATGSGTRCTCGYLDALWVGSPTGAPRKEEK